MDISWDEVKLFLAVAEQGSVSGAARKLRMAQPTLSRRLARLERAVGESLFRRSASGAALTTAGERMVAPARRMAEWAGEVGRAAEPTDQGPQGLVRITAPPMVAYDFLAPFAGWLARHHPGLRVEVLATMQYLDLARGEADLALRVRPPNLPDLKLVHTLETANAVHVAPALARKLPRLRHRFSRPSGLVPLDIDLGPFARGALHLLAARSALDIPRIRLLAQLIETELSRVVKTREGRPRGSRYRRPQQGEAVVKEDAPGHRVIGDEGDDAGACRRSRGMRGHPRRRPRQRRSRPSRSCSWMRTPAWSEKPR
jgi:DNA-binding transcriptional LysR family regulator